MPAWWSRPARTPAHPDQWACDDRHTAGGYSRAPASRAPGPHCSAPRTTALLSPPATSSLQPCLISLLGLSQAAPFSLLVHRFDQPATPVPSPLLRRAATPVLYWPQAAIDRPACIREHFLWTLSYSSARAEKCFFRLPPSHRPYTYALQRRSACACIASGCRPICIAYLFNSLTH